VVLNAGQDISGHFEICNYFFVVFFPYNVVSRTSRD